MSSLWYNCESMSAIFGDITTVSVAFGRILLSLHFPAAIVQQS
ncbi:hypothetical protein QUA86_20405 [Microcoleus sp. F6_B6]